MIRIALCLNRAYTPWAATTMASCLRANSECSIRFEIVHDCSFSKRDIEGLQQIVDSRPTASIDFHPVSPSSGLNELPTTCEFGNVVWLRLYLPEVLAGVSKVLYLDADTFVLGQLTDLWDSPLGEAPLAAVANVVEPPFRSHVAALGINYPGGYFNSGVLLLNLERMRAEKTLERLLRFALDHRHDVQRRPDARQRGQTGAGDTPFRREGTLQALALHVPGSGLQGVPEGARHDSLGEHSY